MCVCVRGSIAEGPPVRSLTQIQGSFLLKFSRGLLSTAVSSEVEDPRRVNITNLRPAAACQSEVCYCKAEATVNPLMDFPFKGNPQSELEVPLVNGHAVHRSLIVKGKNE